MACTRSPLEPICRLAAFYLLAGQQIEAQEILNKYFSPDKSSEIMLGIQKDLERLIAPDA